MNTALITFGIQSVVRLGRISRDALEQHARDAKAVFPSIEPANFDPKVYVAAFFSKDANKGFVKGSGAPYAEFWSGSKPKSDAVSIDALLTAAMKIDTERTGGLDRAARASGALMVRQWSDTAAPVSPWARIVLAAGDIVLEYVAANPAVIGEPLHELLAGPELAVVRQQLAQVARVRRNQFLAGAVDDGRVRGDVFEHDVAGKSMRC